MKIIKVQNLVDNPLVKRTIKQWKVNNRLIVTSDILYYRGKQQSKILTLKDLASDYVKRVYNVYNKNGKLLNKNIICSGKYQSQKILDA